MSLPILVNVAWPYANGPRHIGHVAGFGVPSDIFARYHRMRGNQVLMVSGTDEYGTPITYGADRLGITPVEFADRNNRIIVEDLRALGLSYDLFTRTTTDNHSLVTQDVFKVLYERGYITRRTALGAVDAQTGRTLPDRYIEGTCPICGYTEARGDQCDNCTNQLDPTDLIDPRSRIDGSRPVFRETEHFFLELGVFAARLREWMAAQKRWRPNVRTFSMNLLGELRERAITRDLDWGVTIPLPEYAGRTDKRIYVWFDAVIGYLSASIEWAERAGDPDAWRHWWQNPAAQHFYFMGKDNIVFHSVIWPSMLMGYGDGGVYGAGRGPLQLPTDIVSSEFLTMEGRRFSSSRGVVIYVRDFLSRYDPDALRFFLTIAGPENQDTDFTWSEFVRRNNDELVGTWGNLVHRTLVNAHRNFGRVPDPGDLTEADRRLVAEVEAGLDLVGGLIESARFKAALGAALGLAAQVNQYLGEEEPWRTVKSDPARAGSVLFTALRCVDNLKVMLAPFLPFTCQRLHEMLGYQEVLAPMPEIVEAPGGTNQIVHRILGGSYPAGGWNPSRLPAGRPLSAPRALYRKLDESVVEQELSRLGG